MGFIEKVKRAAEVLAEVQAYGIQINAHDVRDEDFEELRAAGAHVAKQCWLRSGGRHEMTDVAHLAFERGALKIEIVAFRTRPGTAEEIQAHDEGQGHQPDGDRCRLVPRDLTITPVVPL